MSYGPFALKSYPCALCGSLRRKCVLKKRGVVVDREFEVVKCSDCGHHFVDPRIPDEGLGGLYDDAYYRAGGFDRNANYFAAQTSYTKNAMVGVIQTVETALARKLVGAHWLDFGCGPGHLLEAMRERGAIGIGFDESAAAIEICTSRSLKVLGKEELCNLAGTFDAISAMEVIEHVPDPRSFLRHLISFLKPGGIAYVQTGNWNLVKHVPGTPYIMPEGHIHYFTPPELRRLFDECGLDEADTFNRSWSPYREAVARTGRSRLPTFPFSVIASLARSTAPDYAPFPVGVKHA